MNHARIALFIPTLNFGGAEKVVVNLANTFCAKGFLVDLVLVSFNGNFVKHLNPKIRVVNLNSSRLLTCIFPLIKYMWTKRPSVMISAMLRPNIIALVAKLMSCTRLPVIISEHTTLSCSLAQGSKFKASILKLQVRLLYKYAHSIVAVSEGVALDLARILSVDSGSIRVIYNPIVDDNLIAQSLKLPEHPWLLNKSSKVILSVGRLTKAKDYSTLIKSFSIVSRELDSKLIILGDGELRSELEDLIKELELSSSVSMPGYVDNPYSYMRNSDLFVLSSKWEGFGNVVAEALACNVPVVSTNCPSGPSEILEEGRWGTLVPVGNPELLAHAMLKRLKEEAVNTTIDRANYFSVEKSRTEYLELIDKFISKSR